MVCQLTAYRSQSGSSPHGSVSTGTGLSVSKSWDKKRVHASRLERTDALFWHRTVPLKMNVVADRQDAPMQAHSAFDGATTAASHFVSINRRGPFQLQNRLAFLLILVWLLMLAKGCVFHQHACGS
jgi:hypothetical protein